MLLVAGWLAGICVLGARWSIGYVTFVRRLPPGLPAEESWVRQWEELLAEHGAGRAVPLRMTAKVGPALCRLPGGCQLLVPVDLWRELSPGGRLAILRHELAHLKRGDTWKSLFARLAALPHWFNPAAWWAVRKFDEAAEWACDQEATGTASEHAVGYARTLLELGDPSTQRLSCGPAARGRGLSIRVERLLSPGTLEDSVMKKLLVLIVAVGLVAICLLRFDLVAKEPAADRAPAVLLVETRDYDEDGDADLLVAASVAKERGSAKKLAGEVPDLSDKEKPTKARPTVQDKMPLEELRYDGKSFAEWKTEWKTELKPERRAEAINAFTAFGASGYGEESTSAILEVMRTMEMKPRDATFSVDYREQQASGGMSGVALIKNAAIAAFADLSRALGDAKSAYRIPPAAATVVLAEELKEGNRNGRLFAIFALQNMSTWGSGAEPAIPALRDALHNDPDPTVRCCAYVALAAIPPGYQLPPATLRELLSDAPREAVDRVLQTLVPWGGSSASSIFQQKASGPYAGYGGGMGGGYGAGMYSGGFFPHGGGPPRELRPGVEATVQVLVDTLDSENAEARHQAISALSRIGPEAKDVMPALLRAFEKGDPADRNVIVGALESSARMATASGSSGMQMAPIDMNTPAAAEFRRVIPKMVQALDPRNPADLRLLGNIYGRFGPAASEVTSILQKAAEDEDDEVRRTATEVLKAIEQAQDGGGFY